MVQFQNMKLLTELLTTREQIEIIEAMKLMLKEYEGNRKVAKKQVSYWYNRYRKKFIRQLVALLPYQIFKEIKSKNKSKKSWFKIKVTYLWRFKGIFRILKLF